MGEKATVTVDEAARRLGVGRNACYAAVRAGEASSNSNRQALARSERSP